MKERDFKRWLKAQGAKLKNGKKHIKVYLGDKQATIPRHPSKELKHGTVEGIKKQLGLK